MHSRLEKPIIREERAETSSAAFIEFGFPISRCNNWQTQERVFEEKGLIFYLSLKEEVWESIKTIPEPLKMTKGRFQKRFFKIQTGFQKPKNGKKKMDLSWNRIRFNLENWWTTTTIPRSFKIFSRSSFRKWRVSSSTLLFSPHASITMMPKLNNGLLKKTTHLWNKRLTASFKDDLSASAALCN